MATTALAIDFGSSNTAAAFRDSTGQSHKIQLSSEGFLMPSAVFYTEEKVLVGRTAVQAAMSAPDAYEAAPKRRIGDGEIQLGQSRVPVTQLIAAVLTEVLARSYRSMGTQPDEVVLTHPDKWDPARREILVNAAVAAGLSRERVRLVSEATAAAWYYTVAATRMPVGSRLSVFDFGAGTCDVAVLDKQPDETFAVAAADGIEQLGGQDLDARIYAWVLRRLSDAEPTLAEELDADLASRLTLADRIREAKEALSDASAASIVVTGSSGASVLQLTRDEFDDLIGPDIDRAVTLTGEVLASAEKSRAATGPVTIYLTGGSSTIPLVHTRLSGLGPLGTLGDPKTVVAQGALLVPRGPVPVEGSDAATVVTGARMEAAVAAARTVALPQLQLPPAGWYPDPRYPGAKRFWNGTAWASPPPELTRPREATPLPPSALEPRSAPVPHKVIVAPAGNSPRRVSPTAPTQPGVPTRIALEQVAKARAPFAETQVAKLPEIAASNPPEPEKPSDSGGLGGKLPAAAQALLSALLLLPTVGLFFAFDAVGDDSDFAVMWQWEPASTVWFVAPYVYLAAAVLLFGRTKRRRVAGALVAVAAMAVHMGGSALLTAGFSMGDRRLFLDGVFVVSGLLAVAAWGIARRRHRIWLAGLVLAVPVIAAVRYVGSRLATGDLHWPDAWLFYVGGFVVSSLAVWIFDALGSRSSKPARRRS